MFGIPWVPSLYVIVSLFMIVAKIQQREWQASSAFSYLFWEYRCTIFGKSFIQVPSRPYHEVCYNRPNLPGICSCRKTVFHFIRDHLIMDMSSGKRIARFVPTHFGYILCPLVLSTFKWMPMESVVYEGIGTYVLPAALFLLLIGTPLTSIFRMSVMAMWSILFASITMLVASIVSFILFF